jgi:hypothetical protein
MNIYLTNKALLCISFWREKRLKDEVRTSFNMDLYLRVLEAKNK